MRPPLHVRGHTAVVTGAGSGIGRALALHAASQDMAIALCDIDEAGLSETAQILEALGVRFVAQCADVQSTEDLQAFAAATQSLPPIALLFANAGILREGDILTMSPATWRLLFNINVLGVISTVQTFAPIIMASNAPAQIVLTGSTGAMSSIEGLGAYCATKHALWPIAEELRRDLERDHPNIGVSFLMPGAVATHIFDAAQPGRAPPADSLTPEQAAAIAFSGAIADKPIILTHPHFQSRARDRFDRTLRQLQLGARFSDD